MKISPKVRPLFFWSQKVLPLVYDDSLSYYEVISKIANKINEVIEFVNDKIVDVIRESIQDYFVTITYNESAEEIIAYIRTKQLSLFLESNFFDCEEKGN